jgi:DnaJ family protein C protein 7
MALKKFKPALVDCQYAASLQFLNLSPKNPNLARLVSIRLRIIDSGAIDYWCNFNARYPHLLVFRNAKVKKEWGMARLALDKGIEGEGGDIPIDSEWRLWQIELARELARRNWDAASIAAKCVLFFSLCSLSTYSDLQVMCYNWHQTLPTH